MKEIVIKIKDFVNSITVKIGDKNMHSICSFIITFAFGLIDILLGLVIGLLAGFGKEFYDQYRYDKKNEGVGFDKEDIIYDLAGIAIAICILILL